MSHMNHVPCQPCPNCVSCMCKRQIRFSFIESFYVLILFLLIISYPKSYQEEFVRDLFYAANAFEDYLKVNKKENAQQRNGSSSPTLSTGPPTTRSPILSPGLPTTLEQLRSRLSLEEEQRINETGPCRIIGLTLETRPDHISKGELRRLRRFGCTRVQIGIQHTDEEILDKINRGCTTSDAVRALRLLKDGCFKVNFLGLIH